MSLCLRPLQRDALGVLLFGGVLSPLATEALGWAVYPHATIAAAVAVAVMLAAVMVHVSPHRPPARVAYAALSLATAVPLAAVLREGANVFYTSAALFGGLVLLLSLHVAATAMRHVVILDSDAPVHEPPAMLAPDRVLVDGPERLPPNEIRVVRAGRALSGRPTLRVEPWQWRGDSALALGDALTGAATWLLLLFWVLVALGHRHFASACILLVGVMVMGQCAVLLPGVLATGGEGGRPAPPDAGEASTSTTHTAATP